MKTKIAILGSTGSIGKTLLDIIRKDPKNFEITLLTANKNYKLLLKQAKEFKVKNLIITNKKKFDLIKNNSIKLNLNIYNNFVNFSKIFTNKVDYTMSSITGINGLEPTLKIIKYSKRIAIANKESIICGWNLINKELKKNNTDFIPVDSEHFSLWYGIQNLDINNIENNATRFERIIAGIMCYVLYHGRNRPVTKIMYMNSEFKKIICASADTSNYFKMNVTRYIDLNVDPFK